jgi:hypothetical protein
MTSTDKIAADSATLPHQTAAQGPSSGDLAPLFEAGQKLQHACHHIARQFDKREDCTSNFEARTILLRAMSKIYDEVSTQ